MAKLKHNRRYTRVKVSLADSRLSNQIQINDAIIWMIDDNLDIAQFGQNIPVVTIPLDEIKSCEEGSNQLTIHL